MRVVVVGGGGREHAMADRLAQSPEVRALWVVPGNGGTGGIPLAGGGVSENVPLAVSAVDDVVKFCREKQADLVLIGPEQALADGLSDRLRAAGIGVFGPSAAAAKIETDKAWSKQIMKQYSIPTAEARIFTRYDEAKTYVASRIEGVVVKASGLAAGKGVFVCEEPAEALEVLDQLMRKGRFGKAGETVVVEEILNGPELSVFSFVDGNTIVLLDPCQDHKRALDGDQGPNTGGMGAYCPANLLQDRAWKTVTEDIIVPVVDALSHQERPYSGVLYTGLMLTPAGPRVIEFNARFGDPEAQVLLPRLETDLLELCRATAHGELGSVSPRSSSDAAVTVVLASGGYPGAYGTGYPITGLVEAERMEGVKVYHCGTQRVDGTVVTAGGRVLSVTGLGPTVSAARDRAYAGAACIRFEGLHYRRDVAMRAALEG